MSTERTHAEMAELLPLYALGALDAEETLAVERYVAAHPELVARLRELEGGVAALAHLAPAASLPADAKARLLARARADAAPAPPAEQARGAVRQPLPPARGAPARRGAAGWQRLRWAFVAAAFVGLLFWNIQLQRALNAPAAQIAALAGQPDTAVSLLVNTPAAPNAVGRLYLSADGSRGVLAVTGLPAPGAGREYQFWFARPDKSRDSAAIFAVGPQGEALVSVAAPGALGQYDQIWITQEPAGGSAVPTAPHFLEGPLTL
jgi:anti-sigma-K factor RskA